jgi:hypothetical protein
MHGVDGPGAMVVEMSGGSRADRLALVEAVTSHSAERVVEAATRTSRRLPA